MLISNDRISYPDDLSLIAELDVFKSANTFSETPDYTLQRGQDTAIRALCLVTHDVSAEEIDVMWGRVCSRMIQTSAGTLMDGGL